MDDNAADYNVADTSGNNLNATLVYKTSQQIHVSDGYSGGALDFIARRVGGADGQYAFVAIAPQITNAFKVIFYVRYLAGRPDARWFFQRQGNGITSVIEFHITGINVWTTSGNYVNATNSQVDSMTSGVWYKFEAIYDRYADDGIRLKLYMDDILVGSGVGLDEALYSQNGTIIFAGQNGADGGQMDGVEFHADITDYVTTFTLAYSAGANGHIEGDTPQTVNEGADGSPVTAVPDANYHFVNWTNDVS
jgi:hypothetical protein